MTYDYDKFVPKDISGVIEKYKVTTFCAPPTIYRFLIKEDLTGLEERLIFNNPGGLLL